MQSHQSGRLSSRWMRPSAQTRAISPSFWEAMPLSSWRRPDSTDRKSTRLNSSHANISYAVFCLKKKKKTKYIEDEEVRHEVAMWQASLENVSSKVRGLVCL